MESDIGKADIVKLDPRAATQHVIRAEPKLREWTYQTVHSLALYMAANASLKDRIDPESDASQLADRYRQPSALMTAIRVDSLFDRHAEISFQTVYREISRSDVQSLIVEDYLRGLSDPRGSFATECRGAIDRFLSAYQAIDFRLLGRLQHLRNIGIAHITLQEVSKSITYDELEHLVRLACTLTKELTLAVRGLATSPTTDLDGLTGRVLEEWLRCMTSNPSTVER